MLRVGLTGGIGAGKTLVSNYFADLGIPVIDADHIAHALTVAGSPACEAIKAEFGTDFFFANGALDRRKLRQAVFSNPAQLKRLEAILHPRIRERIEAEVGQLREEGTPYCIVAMPLLIEADMLDLVDKLIVVDVPEAMQIQRVIERDQTSPGLVEKILGQQASRDRRLALADHVIDNSASQAATRRQVEALDNALRRDHSNSP